MPFIHEEVFKRVAGAAADVAAVRESLQTVIEIEHATIPPYLFALFSLKAGPSGGPGVNEEVVATLRSVVSEEMLHMALACNVLNALGGRPEIDTPQFIPKYPGILPATVAEGTVIDLAPFSKELVRNVFMAIEQPSVIVRVESEKSLELSRKPRPPADPNRTIGDFYRAILRQIGKLDASAFTGCPGRQIHPRSRTGLNELIVVNDVQSASKALSMIISQGEGEPDSPLDAQGVNAHYYRFLELSEMRKLKLDNETKSPDSVRLTFGRPIPFDASAVLSVPAPTKADSLEPRARRALNNFNYTYTTLLKVLHTMFNGEPERYDASYGVMTSLRQQAIDMMSGTNLPYPVAPTFEYLPVNPA